MNYGMYGSNAGLARYLCPCAMSPSVIFVDSHPVCSNRSLGESRPFAASLRIDQVWASARQISPITLLKAVDPTMVPSPPTSVILSKTMPKPDTDVEHISVFILSTIHLHHAIAEERDSNKWRVLQSNLGTSRRCLVTCPSSTSQHMQAQSLSSIARHWQSPSS